MKDRDLLEAFEGCAMPNHQFRHADHVHVAWAYLSSLPLLEEAGEELLGIGVGGVDAHG